MRKEKRKIKDKTKRKDKRKRREKKYLFILKNTQTNRKTDRQIDTNHSLIWDEILNNIANQI